MQSDLHKIIVSPQPLSSDHAKVFLYQILRGLCRCLLDVCETLTFSDLSPFPPARTQIPSFRWHPAPRHQAGEPAGQQQLRAEGEPVCFKFFLWRFDFQV